MNLHKLILTNNACYKAGRTITPNGIMVHSTGVNNPNLKRIVSSLVLFLLRQTLIANGGKSKNGWLQGCISKVQRITEYPAEVDPQL